MQVGNTTRRWGAVSKLLHWLVVVLVIAQFALARAADGLPLGMAKLALLARHKSVGLTILALALPRLAWRASQPTPGLPPAMPRWQRGIAHGSHHLLHALLLAMPLSGWLMSSAKNFPVSWFGLVQLPDLVRASDSTYRFMHEAHEIMAGLLFATALLHLAGALKHHFVDRDDVLKRMLPFVRSLLTVAALPAMLLALAPPVAMAATTTATAMTQTPTTVAAAAAAAAAPAKDPATGAGTRAAAQRPLVRYALDPARSTLEFRFRQAGAETRGRFARFTTRLDWPAQGASSAAAGASLEVDIEVASLDTADRDRDGTLRGADLFAVERFPRARFTATSFAPAAAGSWLARGTLRIRDQERALALPLTLAFGTRDGRRSATLRGSTSLRRLDFGVGQGEWRSTEWVGDDVVVEWKLELLETK